jgi:hypothetical protein
MSLSDGCILPSKCQVDSPLSTLMVDSSLPSLIMAVWASIFTGRCRQQTHQKIMQRQVIRDLIKHLVDQVVGQFGQVNLITGIGGVFFLFKQEIKVFTPLMLVRLKCPSCKITSASFILPNINGIILTLTLNFFTENRLSR